MPKPASKKLQAVRVLMLLTFFAFGVFGALAEAWLFTVVMFAGCGGALAALIRAEAP